MCISEITNAVNTTCMFVGRFLYLQSILGSSLLFFISSKQFTHLLGLQSINQAICGKVSFVSTCAETVFSLLWNPL